MTPVPRPEQVPVVTLYRRDGIVQLNKAATLLINPTGHTGIDLLQPLAPEQPWKLDRRLGSPGLLNYTFGRPARFRAYARLFLFFAGQPTTINSLKFEMKPDPDFPDLYLLCPLN